MANLILLTNGGNKVKIGNIKFQSVGNEKDELQIFLASKDLMFSP
jgi:hypothetical protein